MKKKLMYAHHLKGMEADASVESQVRSQPSDKSASPLKNLILEFKWSMEDIRPVEPRKEMSAI